MQGVRGMRVGGQRKLLVPPQLAYGTRGYGESLTGPTPCLLTCALIMTCSLGVGRRDPWRRDARV